LYFCGWKTNKVYGKLFMLQRITLIVVLYAFAGILTSYAQETLTSDSLLRDRDKVTTPLLPDSLKLQPNRPVISIPPLEMQGNESLLQQPVSNIVDLDRNDSIIEPFISLHPKFKPILFFDLGASRWTMPMIGETTTFTPSLNYQLTKKLSFYGGINATQYHNLAYAQSLIAPNWTTRSNIILDGFVGANYRLHDRIILHGTYQRSIYNQLPRNMMMFAPGQNVVVTGASLDVWNGLGVTVDHVWEFDRYGNMRKGFRYSPYIDVQKFIKFLRQ
jgi:hypothetical protein